MTSPTPWRLLDPIDCSIVDARGRTIAYGLMREDAVRIISAVNASAGIDPASVARVVSEALTALEGVKHPEHLARVLSDARAVVDSYGVGGAGLGDYILELRTSLADLLGLKLP